MHGFENLCPTVTICRICELPILELINIELFVDWTSYQVELKYGSVQLHVSSMYLVDG